MSSLEKTRRERFSIRSIGVYDFCIILMIITSLAFYDIKLIFLGSQALAFGLTILNCIKHGISGIRLKYAMWLVIFAFYSFCSIFWADRINDTVFSCTFSIVQVGLVGLSMLIYARNERKVYNCIFAFILSAAALCIRFVVSVPVTYWGNGDRLSRNTIFGSNDPAMILAFSILIVMWIVFFNKNKYGFSIKMLSIVFSAVCAFVSMMSGTKKGLLILAVGMAVLMLGTAKKPLKLIGRIVCIVILGIGMYFAVMEIPVLYGAIGYRIEKMVNMYTGGKADMSTIHRSMLIEDALRIFKDNPILGIGQDGFRYVNRVQRGYYSHNNYVELLANLGLVGFVAYYGFIVSMLIRFLKGNKQCIFPLAALMAALVIDYAMVSYSAELSYICFAICLIAYEQFVNKRAVVQ